MLIQHQRGSIKHVGKSEYKYVYPITLGGRSEILYHTYIQVKQPLNKWRFSATYTDEREAAIAVDKKLIEKGLEPVNILKKK